MDLFEKEQAEWAKNIATIWAKQSVHDKDWHVRHSGEAIVLAKDYLRVLGRLEKIYAEVVTSDNANDFLLMLVDMVEEDGFEVKE